jgi:hypothetical protein
MGIPLASVISGIHVPVIRFKICGLQIVNGFIRPSTRRSYSSLSNVPVSVSSICGSDTKASHGDLNLNEAFGLEMGAGYLERKSCE